MAPNQNTPDPTPPEVTPSGNVLLPSQKLEPRVVTGIAPGVKVEASEFDAQGRYIGQRLVNKEGIIGRARYGQEAYAELARFKSAAERKNFLNRLYQVGLYQGSKPSPTGFSSKDLSVMQDALDWANWRGVEIDVAATLMPTELGTVANGGNRIRTTAKEDLRTVFKQTASSVLGRQLSDSEVEKFVRSYNQKEVSDAMGGAAAPNPQVAAQEAVTAAAPDEAAAMGALTLTNIFDDMIKGLG